MTKHAHTQAREIAEAPLFIEASELKPTPPPAEMSPEHPLIGDPRVLRDRSVPIGIYTPEKLSHDEYEQFRAAIKSKEGRRPVEKKAELDPTSVAFALELQEEVVNSAMARLGGIEAGRLAEASINNREDALRAMSEKMVVMRETVDFLKPPAPDKANFEAYIKRTTIPQFAELENMMAEVRSTLPEDLPQEVFLKVRTQVNGLVARVYSDNLLEQVDGTPNVASLGLTWKSPIYARQLAEDLTKCVNRDEVEKPLIRRVVLKSLMEVITEFNSSDTESISSLANVTQYDSYTPINQQGAEIYRRVMRFEDVSHLEDSARALNAEFKETKTWENGLDLTKAVESVPYTHISVVEGKTVKKGKAGISEVGIDVIADSTVKSFLSQHVVEGALDQEIDVPFKSKGTVTRIKDILNNAPERRANTLADRYLYTVESTVQEQKWLLPVMENICANVNVIKVPDVDEPAERISSGEVLDLFRMHIGKVALEKVLTNADLNVESSMYAVPEVHANMDTVTEDDKLLYETLNDAGDARAGFSESMAFLSRAVKDYENRIGRDDASSIDLSYAVANAISKARVLRSQGLSPIEAIKA